MELSLITEGKRVYLSRKRGEKRPIPTPASNSKVLMDKALRSRKHANVSKNVSRPKRDAKVRPLCAASVFTVH